MCISRRQYLPPGTDVEAAPCRSKTLVVVVGVISSSVVEAVPAVFKKPLCLKETNYRVSHLIINTFSCLECITDARNRLNEVCTASVHHVPNISKRWDSLFLLVIKALSATYVASDKALA